MRPKYGFWRVGPNPRTVLKSGALEGSEGGFFIDTPDGERLATVKDDSEIRERVAQLLAAGAAPFDLTKPLVWE